MHKLPSCNRVTTVQNLTPRRTASPEQGVFSPVALQLPPFRRGTLLHLSTGRLAEQRKRRPTRRNCYNRDGHSGPWPLANRITSLRARWMEHRHVFPGRQSLPSRRQLEQLLESEPDDVFLRYALAKACISEGDIESGLTRFRDVIDRQPDYVPAYFQAGQALADHGRLDEAREIVARGIEIARRVGDRHAESEMTEFLDSLGAN